MNYNNFMSVMCFVYPYDFNKCKECGGSGLSAVRCCSGLSNECGCMGLPVEFEDCKCGLPMVKEQELERMLKEWVKNKALSNESDRSNDNE